MDRFTFIFNLLTIFIGIATIITNIWIARYNAGKNRKIHEIKSLFTGDGANLDDINKELSNKDYAILHIGQDFSNTRRIRYILGRVK